MGLGFTNPVRTGGVIVLRSCGWCRCGVEWVGGLDQDLEG